MSPPGLRLGVNGRNYDKDNGQPGLLAPSGRGWWFSTSALTASRATFLRVVPSRTMTITLVGFGVSTAAGADDACDVGIYNSALSRIVSAGATTGKLNSTGPKTVAIAATTLQAGTVYYAAFSVGTFGGTAGACVTAQLGHASAGFLFGTTAGLLESDFTAASHPLPVSLTASAGTGTVAPVALVLRES